MDIGVFEGTQFSVSGGEENFHPYWGCLGLPTLLRNFYRFLRAKCGRKGERFGLLIFHEKQIFNQKKNSLFK